MKIDARYYSANRAILSAYFDYHISVYQLIDALTANVWQI